MINRIGRFTNRKFNKTVWIHAASVGEVKISSLVIKEIKKKWPTQEIVLSVFTDTGMKVAQAVLPKENIFYFPLDLPWIIKKTICIVNPKLFIVIESELWPNLLYLLKKNNVNCIMINGRISESSYNNYRRIPFFPRWVLQNFCACAMRTKDDKDRLITLRTDSNNCIVTGNLKIEDVKKNAKKIKPDKVKQTLFLDKWVQVITFGCTRDGEELELIPLFTRLLTYRNLIVVVSPRHVERIEEITNLFYEKGLSSIKKSDIINGLYQGENKIVLVDTIGELFPLYSISAMAFVGGSIKPFGGQNILEPAAFGIPVLFGKYMDNFKDEKKMLLDTGCAIEVDGVSDLMQIIPELLTDKNRCRNMGKKALTAINNNFVAKDLTMEIIGKFINE